MGVTDRLASIELFGGKKIDINTSDVMRLLLLDDERHFLEQATNLFKEWGWDVDPVVNLESAQTHLEKRKYQLVIADVTIEGEEITGDEFIVRNAPTMRDASIVLITGKGEDVIGKERREELKSLGVTFLQKGNAVERLREITSQKIAQQQSLVNNYLRQSVDQLIGGDVEHESMPNVYDEMANDLKQMLVDWLESRKDRDQKEICYGGKEYSINELIEEIEQGTEVGKDHIRMMMDLFQYLINSGAKY